MKNLFIFCALFIATQSLQAQNNLSGVYGYAKKPLGNTGNDKNATGPSGNLVLLKMEGNKYRFWLDVTIGWPSYNSGETDGTITFVKDTASFDNTHEGAESSCILKFKIAGTTVHINKHSASFNCGFGNNVRAEGDYTRLATQPRMDYTWLKKQYPQTPTLVITAKKAELFQDENARNPYPKNQSFTKGDTLISIAETERTVYTEFISSTGKFIYGWLKKTDVKMNEGD